MIPPNGRLQLPPWERFPDQMLFRFEDQAATGQDGLASLPHMSLYLQDAAPLVFPDGPIPSHDGKTQGFAVGVQLGDSLTDRSYVRNGLRGHDIFHIANATFLNFSPVMAQMLNLRARSNVAVDHIEQGGVALVAEEAIVLLGIRKRACLPRYSELMTDMLEGCLPPERMIRPTMWEDVFLRVLPVFDELIARSKTEADESGKTTTFVYADCVQRKLEITDKTSLS